MSEEAASLVALYIIGTWVYRVFNAFPYLFILADYGSGKTNLLLVIRGMCCNGFLWVNSSPAVLFRTVDAGYVTLLLDESEALRENVSSRRGEELADLKAVLNSGYRSGSTVPRCTGKEFTPTFFNTYCPKVFASTEPVYPILDSRCLQVELLRTASTAYASRDPSSREAQDRFKDLHDKLMMWALDNCSKILSTNNDDVQVKYRDQFEGVHPRTFQLMMPLLIIYDLLGLGEQEDHNLRAILEKQVERGTINTTMVQKKVLWGLLLLFESGMVGPLTTNMIIKTIAITEEEKKYFTHQKVGYLLRALQVPKISHSKGKATYFGGMSTAERLAWVEDRAKRLNVDLNDEENRFRDE